MSRLLSRGIVLLVLLVAAAAGGWWLAQNWRAKLPDSPVILTQVSEVMKVESLEVFLYKKVEFRPERLPAESFWKDVILSIREAVVNPHGRAFVFATAHLGYDLSRLDQSSIRIQGTRAKIVLPPLQVRIELKPEDTEIIDSNLDSKQTAQLLEHARNAFQQQVERDARLRERARKSAERALKVLLYPLGFQDVQILDVGQQL